MVKSSIKNSLQFLSVKCPRSEFSLSINAGESLIQKAMERSTSSTHKKFSGTSSDKNVTETYYSARKHPKVMSGERKESEVFDKFCRVLDMKDSTIRYSKFYEFFLALSLTIERDNVFINLCQALFGL